jgi:hypothetical protein
MTDRGKIVFILLKGWKPYLHSNYYFHKNSRYLHTLASAFELSLGGDLK